jgi:type II secretion system protein H
MQRPAPIPPAVPAPASWGPRPARGRVLSPAGDTAAGFTLLELLMVLAVTGLVAVLTVPALFSATARLRVETSAYEVVGALRLARSEAVRRAANVGVRFWTDEHGRVTFSLHRDGDGDGVRNVDIVSGVDPALGNPRPLTDFASDVRFGIPADARPRDPADPRRRLTRLSDPIRFNNSEIAAFGPLGQGTAGSLYLTDGRDQLVAVRLYGRSGKLRVERWDAGADRWR